jgi:hypothetical protein
MLTILAGIALAVTLGPIAPDAPAREPQMAAKGAMAALTFGAAKGIYFSKSSDSGKSFSAPLKIAEAEIIPLTRHRGPRIVFTKYSIVISAVVGRTLAEGAHAHGLPSDGDLVTWRSEDGGVSWSKGITINDMPGAATEGLHSLAADASGNLFAAWSKNVQIYQSPEGTICACCHPSIAIDSSGQIAVMWRNWLGGARDMYLTRSRDGAVFSKPERLGRGTWRLNACPMDGGGIAIVQNRMITAWRRDHEIFLASPGEKEVGIGEGVDVALTAAAEGVYAIWSTPLGVRALLPGKKDSITLAPKGAFPTITALRNGHALAAWEEGGSIRIKPVP